MSLSVITGEINPTFDYFKVIKAPPRDIAEVDIVDDESIKTNNLYKKLFQFKYRFVYDDLEKSVWSAVSKVPLPKKSTDENYNSVNFVQNRIDITINTGDINVKKIEIAGRVNIENNWSDFFLIDTLDKKRDFINDFSSYVYIFRNDSVYTPIDIQESNLLFDYVPDKANALELANGNTLVVGGLKDGYNRDTKLDVTLTRLSNLNSPAVLSTLSYELSGPDATGSFPEYKSYNDSYLFYGDIIAYNIFAGTIIFSGIPQVGDRIIINLQGYSTRPVLNDFGTIVRFKDYWFSDMVLEVVVEPNDGISDIIRKFQTHPSRFDYGFGTDVGIANIRQPFYPIPSEAFDVVPGTPNPNALYVGAFTPISTGDGRRWHFWKPSVKIIRSYSFGESDVFPTYKWNGLYKFGLAYYSKDGKTNGVYTNQDMVLRTSKYMTDYQWTNNTLERIIPENETAQLYIGHEPPEWADYYHIVRTKDISCDFSLMVVTAGTTIESGYVFLNIQNIQKTNEKRKETSSVIKYGITSFVEGDRVRILQKYDKVSSPSRVDWQDREMIDIPIISVELKGSDLCIKIKELSITDPYYLKPESGQSYIIEIYRPAKVLSDEDITYYEIGYKYNITTDTSGKKYHGGQDIVNGITLNTFNITSPSSVQFFQSTKHFKVSRKKFFFPLSTGDRISISGTSLNNGTYTISNIVRVSEGYTSDFDATYIYVNEAINNETITTPNVNINRLTSIDKKYAYINMFGDGDYYYKTRTTAIDTSGNVFVPYIVADKNFSETYLSAVWSQGRPLVVDEDIKEEYYPAMLRFSGSYIPGTNINNLSRFYPLNFEEADASFGDILRLKTRENFIRLFQRFKTGMIPIYRSIIVDSANSTQVALSEKLLNKPNYYAGEYGIDKYGSSLVSTDYGDYFVDTVNKAIVRASLDGLTNIGDTYNLATWCNENITEDSYGYGCFNYENRCVVMLIGHIAYYPITGVPYLENNIVSYSEADKKFESFYGFTSAQGMFFANGFIYTFRDKLYVHDSETRNNFYGQQQNASVTTVNNGSVQLKKTYTAMELLANELWTSVIKTGPLTNQQTSLSVNDFSKQVGNVTILNKENKYNATIKRNELSAGGKFFGDTMKGCYAEVALVNNTSQNTRLISVSLKYIQSPITNM